MYFFGMDIPLMEIIFIVAIFSIVVLLVAYFILRKVKVVEDETVALSEKIAKMEETELNVVKSLNAASERGKAKNYAKDEDDDDEKETDAKESKPANLQKQKANNDEKAGKFIDNIKKEDKKKNIEIKEL